MTNISTNSALCPAHYPIILWLPREVLARDDGYVRINTTKYHDWQVLAYDNALEGKIWEREQQKYAEWLSQQPPSVERRAYAQLTDILRRDHSGCDEEMKVQDGQLDFTRTGQ